MFTVICPYQLPRKQIPKKMRNNIISLEKYFPIFALTYQNPLKKKILYRILPKYNISHLYLGINFLADDEGTYVL